MFHSDLDISVASTPKHLLLSNHDVFVLYSQSNDWHSGPLSQTFKQSKYKTQQTHLVHRARHVEVKGVLKGLSGC